MKHCILVKWKSEISNAQKKAMLPDIEALFSEALKIDGIFSLRLLENCIARENRYDLLIELTMTPEALPAYDDSAPHHTWKKRYGDKIDKKAIFDFIENEK